MQKISGPQNSTRDHITVQDITENYAKDLRTVQKTTEQYKRSHNCTRYHRELCKRSQNCTKDHRTVQETTEQYKRSHSCTKYQRELCKRSQNYAMQNISELYKRPQNNTRDHIAVQNINENCVKDHRTVQGIIEQSLTKSRFLNCGVLTKTLLTATSLPVCHQRVAGVTLAHEAGDCVNTFVFTLTCFQVFTLVHNCNRTLTSDGQTDGRTADGRTDGRMHGRTDRQTDRWTDRETHLDACMDKYRSICQSFSLVIYKSMRWPHLSPYRMMKPIVMVLLPLNILHDLILESVCGKCNLYTV